MSNATNSPTPRQADLLAFIRSCDKTPSFEEMMAGIGVTSKGSIGRLIDGLIERGHLERVPGNARSLRIRAGA